jgi:Protein of unknown function (DUF3109)
MFIIDEIEVDEQIASIRFLCDVTICKGACCTSPGGRGAPITDAEKDEIVKAFPAIVDYLPEAHRNLAEHFGLSEGVPGNLATPCLNNAACVFVHYVDGIAKCAFETAYLANKTTWRKPLSCHLFPIRLHPSGKKIYYEFFEECHPALHLGEHRDARLQHVLRDPLERAFGKQWTKALHTALDTQSTSQG